MLASGAVADTAWVKAQLQLQFVGGNLVSAGHLTLEAFYLYLRTRPEFNMSLYRRKAGGSGSSTSAALAVSS
ncbi:hypothetical protein BC829DRAFT_442740 [Chytridium lagenaria]|nr:hypothetical protein BC829DRAFT_442740 [Chytridium lagenaria]